MKNDPKKLLRFTPFERANHWLAAITFILLALSGLVFFHPAFYPLSQLFGGGVWTRILHPFFGVVMAISFGVMFFNYRKLNVMTPTDREWLGHVREMVNGDDRNMPEAGKFNGGQKLLFWLLVACMALLILSGIVIWRAYFSFLFPVSRDPLRLCRARRGGAGMIALIIFHIYAGHLDQGEYRRHAVRPGQARLGETASPGMVSADDGREQMNTEARILEPGQIEAPAGEIRFLFLPGRDLFSRRAERFRFLSDGHPLGDYLAFLAQLADAQQEALNQFPSSPCLIPKNRRSAASMACRSLGARSWPRDPAWREGLTMILRRWERPLFQRLLVRP